MARTVDPVRTCYNARERPSVVRHGNNRSEPPARFCDGLRGRKLRGGREAHGRTAVDGQPGRRRARGGRGRAALSSYDAVDVGHGRGARAVRPDRAVAAPAERRDRGSSGTGRGAGRHGDGGHRHGDPRRGGDALHDPMAEGPGRRPPDAARLRLHARRHRPRAPGHDIEAPGQRARRTEGRDGGLPPLCRAELHRASWRPAVAGGLHVLRLGGLPWRGRLRLRDGRSADRRACADSLRRYVLPPGDGPPRRGDRRDAGVRRGGGPEGGHPGPRPPALDGHERRGWSIASKRSSRPASSLSGTSSPRSSASARWGDRTVADTSYA